MDTGALLFNGLARAVNGGGFVAHWVIWFVDDKWTKCGARSLNLLPDHYQRCRPCMHNVELRVCVLMAFQRSCHFTAHQTFAWSMPGSIE